jgi:ABC-2 type transport system permease protein
VTAVALRHEPHTSVRAVAAKLAWRSISLIPRSPATFIPSLIFPIFSVVAFSGAFSGIARVPGFPAKTMVDWILPMSVVQGAAFAGVTTGLGVARDIEGGFFDRLLVAPVRPVAIVLGPLAAALLRAVMPFAIVTAAGLAAGAHLQGGLAGLLVLFIAAEGSALAAAGWSTGLALRFGSMKVSPLIQAGLFMFIFLSTAQVPLTIMTGWLHAVARINPMTNILALGRAGFVGHVVWASVWPGLIAIAGLGSVLTVFAFTGLRKRVP